MKVTTAHCHAKILELKNVILQNLSELCQFQHTLMPGLAPPPNEAYNNEAAEDSLKLWLPSKLSAGKQGSWCLPNIPALKFHFCYT